MSDKRYPFSLFEATMVYLLRINPQELDVERLEAGLRKWCLECGARVGPRYRVEPEKLEEVLEDCHLTFTDIAQELAQIGIEWAPEFSEWSKDREEFAAYKQEIEKKYSFSVEQKQVENLFKTSIEPQARYLPAELQCLVGNCLKEAGKRALDCLAEKRSYKISEALSDWGRGRRSLNPRFSCGWWGSDFFLAARGAYLKKHGTLESAE